MYVLLYVCIAFRAVLWRLAVGLVDGAEVIDVPAKFLQSFRQILLTRKVEIERSQADNPDACKEWEINLGSGRARALQFGLGLFSGLCTYIVMPGSDFF
jgi:hypothetical protein